MNSSDQIKVSIIVPVFNEEKTIISILKKVNLQKVDSVEMQIVVVDDGSNDSSLELLKKNPDLFTKLIKLSPNRGKGAAVRVGLESATGDYVLFQDADLEYDPKDYEKLFLPIKEFNADIVFGSRLMAPPLTRVHYFWHKVGNGFITFLFNILNNTTFTDVYSGYFLYRRSLIDPKNLRSEGWEQQAEILSKAVRKARVIYEVPVAYYGRTYDEGKKIRFKHVAKIIGMMFREKAFPSKN